MNPTMNEFTPSNERHMSLRQLATAGIVAGALLVSACGGDNDNNADQDVPLMSVDTAGTSTSAETAATVLDSTTAAVATTTPGERTPLILDGSDTVIAADAHITRCGVDGSQSEWSANAESYILNQEANQDLLRSKEQVLFEKIGVNAANILVTGAFVYDDVDSAYTNSDSLYTRLIARFDAIQMTDQAVAEQPNRQNFRCVDENLNENDNTVGDKSEYRDDRANRNNNVNATLLAITVPLEVWDAAVTAGTLEGKDLEGTLLTQKTKRTVLDADGKEIEVDVVEVFEEDDSCGNQVFQTPPETPETPPETVPPTTPNTPPTPTTPPTTPNTPPNTTTTTVPNSSTTTSTTEYEGPKNDTNSVPPTIPNSPDKESDHGAGDPVGSGNDLPGQSTDGTIGTIAGESSINTQPLAPATTEAAPVTTQPNPNTIPPTSGAAPTSTNPPVNAPDNSTAQNAPLPTQP